MSEESLGDYRLLRLLATGGMGEVFLAERRSNPGVLVVVKRLLRHLALDASFVERFTREATLAAAVVHPNVARVFGVETAGDDAFLVMEFIYGRTLRALIETARESKLAITPAVAVWMVAQVLKGLEAAHHAVDAQGKPLDIIHGDVTPENIMVSYDGRVALLDFGIAHAMPVTMPFRTPPMGKLGYVAPEIIASENIDRRADVFAAGMCLYELLTLKRPPPDARTAELTTTLGQQGVEPALVSLIGKAINRSKTERFGSAGQMSEALERWLQAGRGARRSDAATLMMTAFLVPADSDPLQMLPPGPLSTAVLSSESPVPSGLTDVPPARAPRFPLWWIALGLAVLGVAFTLLRHQNAPVEPPPVAAPTPVVADPEPAPAPIADAGAQAVPVPAPTPTVVDAGVVRAVPPHGGKGRAVFDLPRGTMVVLDGVKVGPAPLSPRTLAVGTHTLQLKPVGGAAVRQSIRIEAGKDATVRLPPKKKAK